MADLLLGGIILLTAVRGFFKGFLGEFMTLAGWIICVAVVYFLAEPVSQIIPADYAGPSVRYAASFAGLLLLGLIAWAAFQKQLLQSIRDRGISTVDSLLGALLGAFFGALVCVLVLMLVRAFLPPESPSWWVESQLISVLMQFEDLILFLRKVLWDLFD